MAVLSGGASQVADPYGDGMGENENTYGEEIPVEFEEDGQDTASGFEGTKAAPEEGEGGDHRQEDVSADGISGNGSSEDEGSADDSAEAEQSGNDSSERENEADHPGDENGAGTEDSSEGNTAEDAVQDAESSDEGSQQDASSGKTSFFGRKKKDKEREKLEKQVEELTDKLKRSLAEFDNFRKRTEKEKASMYVVGARDIVEKMLPIVDSFERGLSQAPEGDAFADGMKMVYRQMVTALEELGVKPIEAVGKEFDPNFHNAVMHVEDEEAGTNIVVEEFQKGYTYKDSVVRYSMVKVAN